MKNKVLYWVWSGLFILCGLMGFIPEPAGLGKWALTVLSLAFFLPGFLLLRRGQKTLVRNLSLVSLLVTLLLLVLNFMSGQANQAAGEFLYGLLVILSAPMVCSQYWVLSLFLWACLLMASLSKPKKGK